MPTFITQPMVQFLALGFTAFSAFFFIREVAVASSETFAELARTKWDYNLNLVKTFARQKADAIFGFSFLMISISMQTINLIFPVRFIDLDGLPLGKIIILVITLVVIFLVSLRVNKSYTKKVETRILMALGVGK